MDVANLQTYQLVVSEGEIHQIRKLAKLRWNGAWARGRNKGFIKGGDADITTQHTCQLVGSEVEILQLRKLAKLRKNGAWTRGGNTGFKEGGDAALPLYRPVSWLFRSNRPCKFESWPNSTGINPAEEEEI